VKELSPEEEVSLRTRANMGRSYLSVPAFFLAVLGVFVALVAPLAHESEVAVWGLYLLAAAFALYLFGELLNLRRARARAIVQMIDRERAFTSSMIPME